MDNELSDDGSPQLMYTRSVRRRKKALALDSPDEHIDNSPPASCAVKCTHFQASRMYNRNKTLAFGFDDAPPWQTGDQEPQASCTGSGVLQPQCSRVSEANVMHGPAVATQRSNISMCASALAWSGSPAASPGVQQPFGELAATGHSSAILAPLSHATLRITCAEGSIALAAASVAHSVQAKLPVGDSCSYSSPAACCAGNEPGLWCSPAGSNGTRKPDAGSDGTTADQAAPARVTGATSAPILVYEPAIQPPGSAHAAVPTDDDIGPDNSPATPTIRQKTADVDPASAACAHSGGFIAIDNSSCGQNGSPATCNLLLQRPLDIDDPYTPWLRTNTKPPRPGSGSLFGSPVSLSSSCNKSCHNSTENGNSSHQVCRMSSPEWNAADGQMEEGSTSAAVVVETAVAEDATSLPSPDCNVSLSFMTPINARCNASGNGGSTERSGSSSGEGYQPRTFTRRMQEQDSKQSSEERQPQQYVSSPQLQDSSSDGTGTTNSSSSEDEDDVPLTFTRRKRQQQHSNVSSDQLWQTPRCNMHGVSSLQCRTRSGGGSSDAGSSSSATSWYSDSEGEQSSDSNNPLHSWKPAVSGGGRLGGKTECGSNNRHGCSAGTTGSCGRITPGSSSSLVARRRRQLQTPSAAGLPQQQHQPNDIQQQRQHLGSAASSIVEPQEQEMSLAGNPYDFEAYLEEAHTTRPCLTTIGRRQQQQQQVAAGRSSISPRAVLSFTPAAAGHTPAAERDTYSPAVWSSSSCKGGVILTSATGRHLAFACPTSPPLLKPHILCSPRFDTPKPLASLGRKGRAVPVSVVGGGKQPTAAVAGDAASCRQLQLGCMTAPAKAPSSRTFARQRQQLSQQLYDQWNAQVFDGGLPSNLPLVYNPRLTSTAGQVVDDGSQNRLKASLEERVPVRLELSTKVLDCEARLRATLAHEMCHVAAWAISREFKQHHGPAFWAWARRFEARVPGIKISTCHNYEIHAPFRWQCCNHSCGKQYHRHKRSIDPNKHACSRCNGTLLYLGKFSKDGRLVGSTAAGACTPGATPGAGGNVFSQFVKAHFAQVKRSLPAGTPHKEIMSRLAADYKHQKAAAESVQKLQQQRQQPDLVDLADCEDEITASRHQEPQRSPSSQQQQQQHEENLSNGLLSFMQRLNLASE